MCIDCEANTVLGVEIRKLRFSDFFCTQYLQIATIDIKLVGINDGYSKTT